MFLLLNYEQQQTYLFLVGYLGEHKETFFAAQPINSVVFINTISPAVLFGVQTKTSHMLSKKGKSKKQFKHLVKFGVTLWIASYLLFGLSNTHRMLPSIFLLALSTSILSYWSLCQVAWVFFLMSSNPSKSRARS